VHTDNQPVTLLCRGRDGVVAVPWRKLVGGVALETEKGVAVRKMTRQSRPMSRNRKGLRAVLREIACSADRSALFWWMVEHHDELAQAAQGRRLRWKPLCERFAALGLTDVKGRVPSERTARATWGRARRAVAEARERAAAKRESAPKRKYPSRVSPNWRPQVASSDQGSGGSVGSARMLGRKTPPGGDAGTPGATLSETRSDAPTEFSTVDAAGNPIEEGKVLYRGQVMTRHAAEQLERLRRSLQQEDRCR
jgi:hypothetical protein